MDHHHRRVVVTSDLDPASLHGPGDVALRDDELDDSLDADRGHQEHEPGRSTS